MNHSIEKKNAYRRDSMGLFMKDDEHLGVFKNNGRLIDNNQTDFRSNYLSDMISDQQAANQLIHRAIQSLKNTQSHSNQRHIQEWETVDKQLNELKELHIQHEQIEKQVTDWLEKLAAKQDKLQMMLADEQLEVKNVSNQINEIDQSQKAFDLQLKQIVGTNKKIEKRLSRYNTTTNKIVKQLNHYHIANADIVQRLDQYEKTANQLDQTETQHTLQQTIANQTDLIEQAQNELINRLESQERLIEQVSRQIDHLRTILYERTNFSDEKTEKAYEHFTKSYSKS